MTLVQKEPKAIKLWTTDIKKVYLGSSQVRPTIDYLCFTANTGGSTVQLTKTWNPTSVTFEISTDKSTRTTYTIWDTITLSNAGDKVYWRNTSKTDTRLNLGNYSNCYMFQMTWSIAGSWDITYLLNKNGTNKLSDYCFSCLFYNTRNLTTPPEFPATTLWEWCYLATFCFCFELTALPKLPAATLKAGCYQQMFLWCSGIKLSTTQGWDYQTEYRIPIEWTWTDGNASLTNMFSSTWWTFTWTPTINTTYYTSNTLV